MALPPLLCAEASYRWLPPASLGRHERAASVRRRVVYVQSSNRRHQSSGAYDASISRERSSASARMSSASKLIADLFRRLAGGGSLPVLCGTQNDPPDLLARKLASSLSG